MDSVRQPSVDAGTRRYSRHAYIEAGPARSTAVNIDEDYFAALKHREEYLTYKLGFRSARILSVDVADLAPGHATARVRWRMEFAPPDKDTVVAEFDQTYVVRCDDQPQILLYIAHQGEEETMRSRSACSRNSSQRDVAVPLRKTPAIVY